MLQGGAGYVKILKSTGSWIEKNPHLHSFAPLNYCVKSATKWHENMMPTWVYFTNNWLHDKQIVISIRENKTLMVTKII